jgi:hypothetical protein
VAVSAVDWAAWETEAMGGAAGASAGVSATDSAAWEVVAVAGALAAVDSAAWETEAWAEDWVTVAASCPRTRARPLPSVR